MTKPDDTVKSAKAGDIHPEATEPQIGASEVTEVAPTVTPSEDELRAQEEHARMIAMAEQASHSNAIQAHHSEEDHKALVSGKISNMTFTQGLKLALGKKNIYFSARHPEVQSPEGIDSVTRQAAVYLRPVDGRHIVQAEVLRHDMLPDELMDPKAEDLLCKLPLVYSLNAANKPIADITEEEAKSAGYSRRMLQARLELQSDKAFDFEQKVAGHVAQVAMHSFQGDQQQLSGFLSAVVPRVIEGLRFGRIMGDKNVAQQAIQFMNNLYASLEDTDFQGTADMFSIGVAEVKDMVDGKLVENEHEARKTLGTSLLRIHNSIPGFNELDKDIRNEMYDVYGGQEFRSMMESLQKRGDELIGKNGSHLSPAQRADMQIKYLMAFPGNELRAIQFRRVLEDVLDNPADFARIQGELEEAISKAESAAPKARRLLG